jgi:hypothetical protein
MNTYDEKSMADAPSWMSDNQAQCWAIGYNAAVKAINTDQKEPE